MSDTVQTAPARPGQVSATGAGAQASTPADPTGHAPPPVAAVVVLVITADRIVQRAELQMGACSSATRTWVRAGAGGWRSRDPDFMATAEEALGYELAEYMDGLELPERVADMLPRHPADPHSLAYRQAMAALEAL